MAFGHLFEGRLLDPAHLLVAPHMATGVEAASGRGVQRAGDVPLEQYAQPSPLQVRVGHRDGREQGMGVGVHRLREQPLRRGALHDLAQVHHRDVVAHMAHHRQVVGDEQVGEAQLLLELVEEVQHLGLDRHVEGGYRLIEHQEAGIEGQRPGHADALALPAGELVRVAVDDAGIEADQPQQFAHPGVLLGTGHRGVHLQRLPQRLAHRHARVQRGEGILEHDLHVAAQPAKVGPAAGDDVDPLSRAVVDRAPQDHFTRGRFDQPKDAPCGGGLSAARLPHQAQRAPETDIEGQASHRGDLALLPAEPAAAHLEGLDEVTHREGRVTARAVGLVGPSSTIDRLGRFHQRDGTVPPRPVRKGAVKL